jgi:hypothetical protein
MPGQFSRFLTEDYVVVECDQSTWEDHGGSHGQYQYPCYWEGAPYQPGSRLLMRVPTSLAHHFTGTGGFRRVDD